MGDGRGVDGARGADSVSGGPGEVGDAGACGGSLFVTLWLVTEKGGGRRRASRAASRRQGSVRAAPAQRGTHADGDPGSLGWAARSAAHPRLPFSAGDWRCAALAAQRQSPAPVAEVIRTLELVVNGALEIAAHRGKRHPRSVAYELVEMVMRGTAGY